MAGACSEWTQQETTMICCLSVLGWLPYFAFSTHGSIVFWKDAGFQMAPLLIFLLLLSAQCSLKLVWECLIKGFALFFFVYPDGLRYKNWSGSEIVKVMMSEP